MKSSNNFIRKYLIIRELRKNISECKEQQDAEDTKSYRKVQQSKNDSSRDKNENIQWMSAIDELANEFDKRIQIEEPYAQLKPVKRKPRYISNTKDADVTKSKRFKKEQLSVNISMNLNFL